MRRQTCGEDRCVHAVAIHDVCGVMMTIAEIAMAAGVSEGSIKRRIKLGIHPLSVTTSRRA